MNQPLPYPLSARFGHLPGLRQRTAKEWSSACPVCHDIGHIGNDEPDRFRMFFDDKPLGWCRRCGHTEFADEEPASQPDIAKLLELEEVRQRKAQQENERLCAMIAELQKKAYWKGWHDSMSEGHRALWRQAGIPDNFQDYWQLGFTQYHGRDFESPALTIPYFAQDWQATTIQYRLTSPPSPSDKYRFQAGLKAGLWLADPSSEVKNAVLLCEGVKKAAVTFIRTVASGVGKLTVTAVPSKMPGRELLEQLENADPLYICLDPDAYYPTKAPNGKRIPPAVNRIIKMVKSPKRIIKLPCKADDFFMLYGGTPEDFMKFAGMAGRVS